MLMKVSVSPSGEIVEGSSVTLTCSSDANPVANYTWYKENEDSPKASGQIFTITDFRPEHRGSYYCEAKNRRGRHNSTLHLVGVTGSVKSAVAGSLTVFFLVIIFLSVFLLIRRKRSWKQTSGSRQRSNNKAESSVGPENDNAAATTQRISAEQQDEVCYATVGFSKNQEDPLYSNIMLAQHNKQKKKRVKEGDDVVYTAIQLTASGIGREAEEDVSALYSTVKNKRRK
ncbi:B-cell receptor CD22-like [Mugil cephalus]|uniref:B-cell receptor CD22-like n=1 Tax=Mugil cephalus TaxID=48193 RepID=UPI001FB5CB6D|nr:B-cell receptor CD22-like [Mugil cephalus]